MIDDGDGLVAGENVRATMADPAPRPWTLEPMGVTLVGMSDMVDKWLDQFSAALGVAPPTSQEVENLLTLAGIAARSSERIAAPVSTWLAAKSHLTTVEAVALAQRLASRFNTPEDE